MRVDLALFEGDTLLDRGVISIGPVTATDRFEHFIATHSPGSGVAVVQLSDFSTHIDLKSMALDMPIHESADWESIELGRYGVVFRCRPMPAG